VASDWFSTELVSEQAFLTTFCFPPGYAPQAPETIAVNVTRIEREFNAGQTRLSLTVYEL